MVKVPIFGEKIGEQNREVCNFLVGLMRHKEVMGLNQFKPMTSDCASRTCDQLLHKIINNLTQRQYLDLLDNQGKYKSNSLSHDCHIAHTTSVAMLFPILYLFSFNDLLTDTKPQVNQGH